MPIDLVYTQYGPIMNGGVRARGDTAVPYRTILRVMAIGITYCFLNASVNCYIL